VVYKRSESHIVTVVYRLEDAQLFEEHRLSSVYDVLASPTMSGTAMPRAQNRMSIQYACAIGNQNVIFRTAYK
jgi:hypothetical protein